MKKLLSLLIGLLCISLVSADYISYKDDQYWCSDKSPGETFIADCPGDYRIPGDWFHYYHFTQNQSQAYCGEDSKLKINCTYVIKDWMHPNVVGSSSFIKTSSGNDYQQPAVPEFTTISAALALIGAGIIAFTRRNK